MEINDIRIKSIVREYRDAGEENARAGLLASFRKEIELYIYNFPRLAYRKDPDVCSEFYLYALDRLESIARNFPEDGSVRFKTWLNYVLKNQFVNYFRSAGRDDTVLISPEDCEEKLRTEFTVADSEEGSEVREGLSRLPQADRDLLKLYYLPETMEPDDVRRIAAGYGLSLRETLTVRGNIIAAQRRETIRLRKTVSELGGLDRKLTDLKHRLYIGREGIIGDTGDLLAKVARLESRKMRLIRELQTPEREAFQHFAAIFKNVSKARYRLNIARQKLKFEILKLMRSRKQI